MTVYLVVVGHGSVRCTSLSHAHALFNRFKALGQVCFVEVRA